MPVGVWADEERAEIERETAEETARKQRMQEAKEKAWKRMKAGCESPIDAYNAAYDLSLMLNSYSYMPRGNRWLSPNSGSRTPGVSLTDDGRKWLSCHSSDSSIGTATSNGTLGDAFDLFTYYEHGGDRDAAIRAAAEMFGLSWTDGAETEVKTESKTTEERKTGFRFIHVSELELSAPDYLADELVETDSMVVFFGDTGAMKSAFIFDLAFCVASGTDFHGRKVKQGPVVIIIGEGQQGFTRRKTAWEIRNQVDLTNCPLYVSSAPANMTDPAFMDGLECLLDEISKQDGDPALIPIDTLAANFGGADENATKDMNMFVQAMNRLRAKYHATVASSHHVGQTDKTRGRGNRALKAGVDAEYFLEYDEDKRVVTVSNHKMKEGAKPEPMAFKPVAVELPIKDKEGRPVTSFVLEEVGTQRGRHRKGR